jgi:hypothetical protein
MEKTLKIINELMKQGLIVNYAIGGGIAAIFYIESFLTYDLDVFYQAAEEDKGVTTLSPIYNWLKQRGYKSQKEHIIVEGIPVQFIPIYNELIHDAVKEAVEVKYEETRTRVFKPEHLIAIMVQTFRPKDRERLIKMMDEADINRGYLTEILEKYNLKEKFEHFMRLYYEK